MRGGTLFLAAIFLAGCEKPKDWIPTYPPEYLSHWSDRQKERFPELQTVFGPSCIWNWDAGPVATDACYRMTKPKRWTGLWRSDFEESRFCADSPIHGPAEMCDDYYFEDEAWLTGNLGWPQEPKGPPVYGKLYRVELVGRRTEYPGHFGHMGMYDYEMVVDRMISVKEVPDRLATAKR